MVSRETKDIAIAWIGLSIAFALAFSRLTLFGILAGGLLAGIGGFILMFPVSLFVVGTAFVFHELGHRNVARHFNYHAEFRKWDAGLKIALGFAFVLGAIFAAPGAVYIGAKKQKKSWEEQTRWDQDYPEYAKQGLNELGLISVAGVIINILLGFIFLGLIYFVLPLLNKTSIITVILTTVFTLGYSINFILAGFNLLPIGPLDGNKVMKWNPVVWAVLFIPLALWFFLFRGMI